MEDFNINSTLLDKSYNYSNITFSYHNNRNFIFDYSYYSNTTFDYFNYYDYYYNYYYYYYDKNDINDNDEAVSISYVVTCIIICISLPLTLMAIYALYSLVGTSGHRVGVLGRSVVMTYKLQE